MVLHQTITITALLFVYNCVACISRVQYKNNSRTLACNLSFNEIIFVLENLVTSVNICGVKSSSLQFLVVVMMLCLNLYHPVQFSNYTTLYTVFVPYRVDHPPRPQGPRCRHCYCSQQLPLIAVQKIVTCKSTHCCLEDNFILTCVKNKTSHIKNFECPHLFTMHIIRLDYLFLSMM